MAPFISAPKRSNKKKQSDVSPLCRSDCLKTFYVGRCTFYEGVLGIIQGCIEPRMRSCRGCQGRYTLPMNAAEPQWVVIVFIVIFVVTDTIQNDMSLPDFVGVGIGVGAFGPLSCRIPSSHISLDGAYAPCADGLLQTCNLILTQEKPPVTPW